MGRRKTMAIAASEKALGEREPAQIDRTVLWWTRRYAWIVTRTSAAQRHQSAPYKLLPMVKARTEHLDRDEEQSSAIL